mmetsp:Transcript_18666/g.40007  ORF Transcript_18666/g.40007 Transcript_18666/m.40007 type:complete len:264 (+) Transcript_18666:146-937(+)
MKAVIFALSAMVLKASLSAALSPEEVDLTPELLEADDACAEGDEQCYVKLLQLKAEKKEQTLKNSAEPLPADTESEAEDDEAEDQDEPPADDGQDVPENELGLAQAVKDYPSRYNPWQDGNVPIWDKLGLAQDEKAPGNSRGPPAIEDEDQQHPNVAFFEELDSNKDAEIQRSEVDAMLAHRIDLDESDVDRLFQDADKDQSGGLSMVEYEDALEKWSTSCATVHRSWFCSGRTRINCCRHGAVWARCAGGGRAHGCGVRSFR